MAHQDREFGKLLTAIKGDFRETPGLTVDLTQACRLWDVDTNTCNNALSRLVQDQFLKEMPRGHFIRQ